jgi:hypothetical protein
MIDEADRDGDGEGERPLLLDGPPPHALAPSVGGGIHQDHGKPPQRIMKYRVRLLTPPQRKTTLFGP